MSITITTDYYMSFIVNSFPSLCLSSLLGACHSPPRFSFAEPSEAVKDSYDVGTQVRYSCRPGYSLDPGKSPFVTCLENSTWSEVPEFCVSEYLCCFSISIDVQAIFKQ